MFNLPVQLLLIPVLGMNDMTIYLFPDIRGNQRYHTADTGSKISKCENLWEVQTVAFAMIGDALTRTGSSVSVEIWQLTLEVLRKVMDALAAKNLLVEDNIMSRFYTSLLHCLHLVLSDPKGSLSEHVAGFVAALRMFFMYGLTNRSPLACRDAIHKELSSINPKTRLPDSTRTESGPYKPPHLRKREGTSMHPSKSWDSRTFSDHETILGFTSSDSEHSDSDGSGKDMDNYRSSKARIAAIICIQDLCQADPKSLTAHWTVLLPTSDVLHPRKYEATLMTCLLFDPVLKTRISSAATLATMLDGFSSVFLQVAEYKESSKRGSFTALSSSLGQILMQLHTGILYLVQHETHTGLLASLFKVLMLLISATPYARMPGDLLPSVISYLRARMMKGFQSRTDQNGLMATALGCLGAALSISPTSLQVKEILQEEISAGLAIAEGKQSVLSMIFQFSERVTNPTISFEALQVLRAVSHNYPNIMAACWEQVSAIVYGLLKVATPDVPSPEGLNRLLRGDVGNPIGPLTERCIMAAVKVLDECLRAISGFKGTEDLLDDRSLDTPFTSDCTRVKIISSAPSYGVDGAEFSKGDHSADSPGSKQWCEAIEKHLPLILWHRSAMVRAASVTCFAGITSSVFFSLEEEKQEFILSSSIRMALNDEAPSVRSAACRAIGVIACFPPISQRAEILDKFIHAAEINTHDPLVSVRITASWALANICDSLRHRASDVHCEECSSDLKTDSRWIALLADCALRLTKDGDKIKSNAVRALGNLSRFVRFTSLSTVQNGPVGLVDPSLTNYRIDVCPSKSDSNAFHSSKTSKNVSEAASLGDSDWLGRMVQAFVSCVTTGNVKVQWNVCHALSNLFLNETLRLQDMAWAPSVFSILLLLLRDSSNFKIRIHAAAALAVPASMFDYGSSFSDVIQGLEHVLETLGSDQISTASSFKYRDALEKQLTSTTLHVLGLASSTDHQPLKEFLVKKASFLEEWLKSLCSSLVETGNQPGEGATSAENQKDGSLSSMQKKEMIAKTIRSLKEVYERSNHHAIARRFEKLIDCVS
ncbi:HEAT [Macleaya cordata]|uniref:HEAT n=1 Tax=Macleaya cordata TaxID=56857 RepID=A0A200QFZ0_MACCD|nr:HEAT [Macleaya cordata]